MPKFPFTNYHELNLDWILKKVNALFDASEENARTISTYNSRLTSAEHTATSAETAASSAQQLADAAAATAGNALSVAGTADAKADSALTASTDARNAASNSLTIAQEAQQTAGAAVATANDAAATASGLESLANTANQNATAAVETAGTAVTTANNAATAANTADQKAVAAQQTANSAQAAASTNAGNISTLQTNVTDLNRQLSDLEDTVSTTQIINSASGAIASFDDGADGQPIRKLVANIEPVQDLHGYANPWPAGGGANKLGLVNDIDKTVAGVRFTYDANTGLFTVNGTNTNTTSHQMHVWFATGSSFFPNFQIGETYTFFVDNTTIPMYMQFTYRNSSGSVSALGYCNFSYGRLSFIVPDTFVELVEFQIYIDGSATNISGSFHVWLVEGNVTTSAYAPYSNICPISGHTGLSVEVTGMNVWDEETQDGYYNADTGVYISVSGQLCSKNFTPVKPNAQYLFCKSVTRGDVLFYNSSKELIGSSINRPANSTFTTPDNCYFIKLNLGSSYGGTYNHDISINYPSTDTEYHAYQGTTLSITFPSSAGTVYGGTVDVTNGVLTVDRAMVDISTLDFSASAPANHVFRTQSLYGLIKGPASNAIPSNAICSEFYAMGYGPISATDNGAFAVPVGGIPVIFIDHRYSSVEDFISGNSGTQFVYPLATPITYQLTPQELDTLLGTNNIWTDVGTVDVEYPADTKLYIDGKIAELQALVLEN